MAIQFLPPEIVHRIAAGEVIDSLAAVVRELVENSLDAQASRIGVSLWPEQWQVQVADNGQGIAAIDLPQAALPHSTSKFPQRLDEATMKFVPSQLAPSQTMAGSDGLSQIRSLGFRGEALHSLARLARLSICSRPRGQAEGRQQDYGRDGVCPGPPVAVAMAPGTVVTVTELFAAWPARRQVLPHPAQQLRAIQQLIHGFALCHPQVTWQLSHHGKAWFSLWPATSAQALLPQMLRGVSESDLRGVQIPLSQGQTLDLLLGLPDRCHRRRPDWIKLAVNGRCVRLPELEQTLLGALRRSLPRHRFPVAFVQLQVPPDQVDWNRHPAKAELYLRDMEHWQAALQTAVVQALQLGPELVELGSGDRLQTLLKAAEQGAGYHAQRQIVGLPEPSRSSLKALAQLHQTYIVAEHVTGLWLVEQHIAHERVLYEQICDRWDCVPLEPPLMLERLSAQQQTQLSRIGVELDPFGEDLWAARSAPALLASRPDCQAALIELSQGGDLSAAQVATACRSAIRNGTALSLGEMQTLLDQWQQTRYPQTCPHGRPIVMMLEETNLARFFRRHWVIGKSHGI